MPVKMMLLLSFLSSSISLAKILETEKMVWLYEDGSGYFLYDKNRKIWTDTRGDNQVDSYSELNRNDSYVTLEEAGKKLKVKLHSDHLERMEQGESQWSNSTPGHWDDRRVIFFENTAGYAMLEPGYLWRVTTLVPGRSPEIFPIIETKRDADFIFLESPRRKTKAYFFNDAGFFVTEGDQTRRLFAGKWN